MSDKVLIERLERALSLVPSERTGMSPLAIAPLGRWVIDHKDALISALRENEKRGEALEDWQPIETAPEGVEVDVWAEGFDGVYLAELHGLTWWTPQPCPDDWTEVVTPTHWRPRPAPPADLARNALKGETDNG